MRVEFPNGTVQYFEGERGAERMVRAEFANGSVQYYEGEQGAERNVRTELPDGSVAYYEGEKRAERCVCVVPGASEDKAAAEKRYKAMRVAELRSECERLGLATTGVKAALVARLLAA